MGLTLSQKQEFALNSINAEKSGIVIKPITDKISELSLSDGYEIQNVRSQLLLADGKKIIGGKMGLTSKAKMIQMDANEPLYGKLFDYMVLEDNKLVRSKFIHPRVEAELAFIMKTNLLGPNLTASDVLAATDYIVPAFEILDSRYWGFKFKSPDSLADNLSAARILLSEKKISPKEDIDKIGVTISLNGEDIGFATGAAVLGHPARAVAMYANMISRYGEKLLSGQIVLSGAITMAIPVSKGDVVKAEFQDAGVITLDVI